MGAITLQDNKDQSAPLQTAGDVIAMFVATRAAASAPPTPPRLSRSRRSASPLFPMAKISFLAPFAPARSSGIAAVPPRSRSRRSSSRQSKGAKKSRLSLGRARSGDRRRTASPSLHSLAPTVLPVTANSDCPSTLTPPLPPYAAAPRARRKACDLAPLSTETPTTKPWNAPQSPSVR